MTWCSEHVSLPATSLSNQSWRAVNPGQRDEGRAHRAPGVWRAELALHLKTPLGEMAASLPEGAKRRVGPSDSGHLPHTTPQAPGMSRRRFPACAGPTSDPRLCASAGPYTCRRSNAGSRDACTRTSALCTAASEGRTLSQRGQTSVKALFGRHEAHPGAECCHRSRGRARRRSGEPGNVQ
jgi:hypothetical protein